MTKAYTNEITERRILYSIRDVQKEKFLFFAWVAKLRGSYPLSFSIFTSYSIRLLSIVIQYIYQLLYSRIKLTEWTNLNKMEDKIFRLRMRPINPIKIRLTFPLLHEQVNIFTYLGRLSLVSPEWSGYMIKNCFSVWGKY